MDEEIVEYILVNNELGMGIGKTAGQVAHCQTIIDLHYSHTQDYQTWITTIQKKIILSGKQKDLEKWLAAGAVEIRDKGLTEIAPNSLTCVGFPPQPRSNLSALTKRMQLLK